MIYSKDRIYRQSTLSKQKHTMQLMKSMQSMKSELCSGLYLYTVHELIMECYHITTFTKFSKSLITAQDWSKVNAGITACIRKLLICYHLHNQMTRKQQMVPTSSHGYFYLCHTKWNTDIYSSFKVAQECFR